MAKVYLSICTDPRFFVWDKVILDALGTLDPNVEIPNKLLEEYLSVQAKYIEIQRTLELYYKNG